MQDRVEEDRVKLEDLEKARAEINESHFNKARLKQKEDIIERQQELLSVKDHELKLFTEKTAEQSRLIAKLLQSANLPNEVYFDAET